jgi:hypothetical protein
MIKGPSDYELAKRLSEPRELEKRKKFEALP